MTNEPGIADIDSRQRALDPSRSYIVQAPAGSGKTGLLVQRYLVLLTVVKAPEEIIAITFTNKAASEMRQRILQALENGLDSQPPTQAHARLTWELATQALARDQEMGWNLLENSSRLRIQTIDSFCASLASQMPLLSRFGSMPVISEDANALYLQAAQNTLADLDAALPYSQHLANLIQHLDNNLARVERLLAAMLPNRGQWLRHLAIPDTQQLERQVLESGMARLVSDFLESLVTSLPAELAEQIGELARFAAANLVSLDPDSIVCQCVDLQSIPGSHADDLVRWQAIAELLLTRDGAWRKKHDKRNGFPAASQGRDATEKQRFKAMKSAIEQLMESLQGEERLRELLDTARQVPDARYTDAEWRILDSLINVLRIAAAHLELVFVERGQVDFPALSQAALRALGEHDEPTDLALALDYRIQHLLVDEFQDTSLNQFQLLERLTAGWRNEDGHSLFAVGDPMQSIYRFREAEVGLFLDVWQHGLGDLSLEPLRLSVNFRSQQGVVDWINESFPCVFPATSDVTAGAVSYSPSIPFHSALNNSAVTVHAQPGETRDDFAEARKVVSLVEQVQLEHPQGTTAILVRGRSHLAEIIPALQQSGLKFQAVEIASLSQRQVIQDLLALTRALSHRADRIAWLAILRAPYCGLSLQDLYVIAGFNHDRTIIDQLSDSEITNHLSKDGRKRLARILPCLHSALNDQQRSSLRVSVENTWIAMGGPACIQQQTDIEDVEVYLQLLESLDTEGTMLEPGELTQKVAGLFALPDITAGERLQLMTIHKAKGLEFDTVILPSLGRTTGKDKPMLLRWMEVSRDSGNSDLLLAPINATGEDHNPIASYLKLLNAQKSRNEDGRLLYVAATRARQRLHLLGHTGVKLKDEGLILTDPPKDSLLSQLWPIVRQQFEDSLAGYEHTETSKDSDSSKSAKPYSLVRLADDWVLPDPPASLHLGQETNPLQAHENIEFDWASETARQIGTVVHRMLQYIGELGIENINPGIHEHISNTASRLLARLGLSGKELADAIDKSQAAISLALSDRLGRWILSGKHDAAECELALTSALDGKIQHMVIDRTFIDEQGIRWIIDYKTGFHSGSNTEEFLDREQQRYRAQLNGYARVMAAMDSRPIHLGLYFPLLNAWREWPHQ